MTSYMKSLTELLIPPNEPLGAKGDWNSVETDLGVGFPQEYKEFIEHYGGGIISGQLRIFTPFDGRTFKKMIQRPLVVYEEHFGMYSNEFDFFPEPGGLLPFGSSTDSDYLNWITIGPIEKWEIVIWDSGRPEFERTGYTSLCNFLFDVLTEKSIFAPSLISDTYGKNNKPTFLRMRYDVTSSRYLYPDGEPRH